MLKVTEDHQVVHVQPAPVLASVPSRRATQAAYQSLADFICKKSKCKQLHGDLKVLRDTLIASGVRLS